MPNIVLLTGSGKHSQEVAALTKYIHEQTLEPLSSLFPSRELCDFYRDRNTTTISALVDQKGTPVNSLTRNTDGTLTFKAYGDPIDHTINFKKEELTTPFQNSLSQTFLTAAYQELGAEAIAILYDDAHHRQVANALKSALKSIANNTLKPTKNTTDGQSVSLKNVVAYLNKAAKRYMINTKSLTLANRLFHPDQAPNSTGKLTTSQYNTVVMNADIFSALLQTAPNIIKHYCIHTFKLHPEPQRFNHPGQVVQWVKEQTGLSKPEWRVFCRITPKPPDIRDLQYTQEETKLGASALAAANRPEAPPKLLNFVFHRTWHHSNFKNAEWTQGDPWKAWIAVINQFLKPQDPEPSILDFSDVTDALQHHVAANLPWGPANWQTLLHRANRWQRQNQQGRTQDALLARTSHWDSLIDQYSTGNYTFKAATTGLELAETGTIMDNCLGTFWRYCFHNQSRIFTVHQADELIAAAEIRNYKGAWTPGQVEGPHRSGLPATIHQAVRELALAYQRAEEETKSQGNSHC